MKLLLASASRLGAIAALAAGLSLGACSTTQLGQVDTAASQAVAFTQNLCQFVPTVSTVTGIIAALFPGGGAINTVATGVAQDICQAISAAPPVVAPAATLSRRAVAGPMRASLPVVDPRTGVTIYGSFSQ